MQLHETMNEMPRSDCCMLGFVKVSLFFAIFIFRDKGVSSQRLTIAPHGTQIKKLDSGIIFTCNIADLQSPLSDNADSDDYETGGTTLVPADMRWIGPDMEYISSTKGRVYVERFSNRGLRLYITRIKESDAGIYTCKVRLPPSQQTLELETRMFLFEDIKFENTPTSIQYVIGQSPLLECVATGQPAPEISWRFNRRKIPHDSTKYRQEERGLRITNLDLRDNGTYDCRAEVASHGNLRVRTVTVDVLYPPVIRRELKAGVAVKGKSTQLTCEADGNPSIKYEWFKEDQLSNTSPPRLQRVKLPNDGGSYVIPHVTTEHAGMYVCRVSNSLGSIELNITLNVLVVPTVEEMASKTVVEGRTVELPCTANGVPQPLITWKKTGTAQDFTEGIQRSDPRVMVQSIDNSGLSTLVIQAVNRTFSGQYTCTAVNTAGNDSKSVSLTVEFLPTVDMVGDSWLVAWTGEVRNMSCVGRGLPLPTVTWLHRGGQHIVDNDAFSVFTTRTESTVTATLQVRVGEKIKTSLFGNYSCIAKNVHGYMTRDFSLRQAHSPDMPNNVTVVEETSTWIRLSAEQPRRDGGLPITHWIAKYELVDEQSPVTALEFHDEHNITVNGLSPNTAYNFYLSAANQVGAGKAVKFRVKTPSRAELLEEIQSAPKTSEDRSSRGLSTSDDSRDFDVNGAVKNDQPFEAFLPSLVPRGSTSGVATSGSNGGYGIIFLGAIVGIASVMVALLVAIVACFVTSSKRRRKPAQAQRKGSTQQSGTSCKDLRVIPFPNSDFGFPSTKASDGVDACMTSYDGGRNPDVGVALPPTEARYVSLQRQQSGSVAGSRKSSKASVAMTSSPKPIAASSTLPHRYPVNTSSSPPLGCPGSGTLQRRTASNQHHQPGWQTIAATGLVSADGFVQDARMVAYGCPTTSPADRPMSMSELPPPPDFLLEGGLPVTSPPQPDVIGGGSVGRRRVAARPPHLFEVSTDGYRSGDSVDDDIDDFDPTIRMPSLVLQPY